MSKVKQVIVIRKDLNMPAGKLAAQVSHASTGAFLKHYTLIKNGDLLIHSNSKEHVEPWLEKEFTKICLKVDSEQELLDVYQICIRAKIPCSLIKDAGHTVFSEPTLTCLGIGPFSSDKIDEVTGDLKLYR